MKLVQFKQDQKIRLGLKMPDGIVDVAHRMPLLLTMEKLIASGERWLNQLAQTDWQHLEPIPEDKIVYAPCIAAPEKIICIGLNYKDHAGEVDMGLSRYPVMFNKFNNALAAHNEKIPLPKIAKEFDYEVELVIVMGKEAKEVSREEALSYVFGYTVGNDLSVREWQTRTTQWMVGKTPDKFGPIGPYVVTADEIDPDCLDIRCTVNGEVCQSSNTSNMIFDCASIIHYASQIMTLKPGDLIFTGTPAGVIMGKPKNEQRWLSAGDEVIASIENIGDLRNVLC